MRAPKKGKPKRGKPRKRITPALVRNAASIGCTIEEIATVLGVGRSTLRDRITEGSDTFDPAIVEALETGREQGRATLRRLQWAQAKKGHPTMLIWLGKQLLGQRDHIAIRHSGEDGGAIKNETTIRDERSEILALLKQHQPADPGSLDRVVGGAAAVGPAKG